MDLSQLTDNDLKQIAAGNLKMVSTAGLQAISGEPQTHDTGFAQGLIHGVTLPAKTLLNFGADLGGGIVDKAVGMFNPDLVAMNKKTAPPDILAQANAKLDQMHQENSQKPAYGTGDLLGQIGSTWGVGGALAKPLQTKLPLLANALKSGGMSLGGTTGNVLGDIGTRAIGGAATSGLAGGLINPDEAAKSAAIGAAIPVGGAAFGKASNLVTQALLPSADKLQLIAKAHDLGIPLGLASGYDGGLMGGMRSLLNDLPLIGRAGNNAKDVAQQNLNRAVGNTFGAPAPNLTPEIMSDAKQAMGNEFDRIWGNNTLQLNPKFLNNLDDLKSNAAMLPKPEALRLNNTIDDFLSKRVDTGNGSVISGDVANRFQSSINKMAGNATGFLKNDLQTLRQNILSEFNSNLTGDDAAKLTANRLAYKNFKTIEPLLNSAEAGVAGRISGDVPISLLPNAVNKNFNNPAGLPLTDISQVASRLMTDRVKQTGGSARAMIQNSAIGTGGMMGLLHNPLLGGLTLGGLGTIQHLINSPKVAKLIANSQPQQQGLLDDLLPYLSKSTPALLNAQ